MACACESAAALVALFPLCGAFCRGIERIFRICKRWRLLSVINTTVFCGLLDSDMRVRAVPAQTCSQNDQGSGLGRRSYCQAGTLCAAAGTVATFAKNGCEFIYGPFRPFALLWYAPPSRITVPPCHHATPRRHTRTHHAFDKPTSIQYKLCDTLCDTHGRAQEMHTCAYEACIACRVC